jgi:MFS family permease
LTLNGLIIVFFQYPFTWITARFAHYRSLMIGAFLYGIGYLTLTWVGPYGLAIVSIALVTAGEMIISPTSLTVIGQMASESWRGRYMAFAGLAETLGFSLGPLIGGFLLDVYPTHPGYIWGTISALAFAAVIGFQWWGRRGGVKADGHKL